MADIPAENAIGLISFLETTQFNKGLSEYLTGLNIMNSETATVAAGVSGSLTAVGGAFVNIGAVLSTAVVAGAVAATVAIAGIATAGVGLAAGLEEQLDTIVPILGASAEGAEKLQQIIEDLGVNPNLKVSALEAAEAIEFLARNGLTLDEILNGAAESTILLANATGADFAASANVATDVLDLFGIAAEDLEQAIDGIVGVTVNSKFTFDDYALALANAGGTAKAVGLSFEDFNAVVASSASFFKGGARAGTALNSFLLSLQPSTEKAKDEFERLGLITEETGNQFFDAAGNLKSIEDIIVVLQGALGGLTKQQQISAANTLFQREALGTVFTLLDTNAEAFGQLSDDVNESGQASELAAERMANLSGAFEILQGIIDTILIRIGNQFLPLLTQLTERVSAFVEANQDKFVGFFEQVADVVAKVLPPLLNFIESLVQGLINAGPGLALVVGGFGAMAAAAGPLLIVVGGLLVAVGSLIPVVTTFAAAISTVGIPVLLAIGAAIAAVLVQIAAIATVFAVVATAIATNFGGLGDAVKNLFQGTIIPAFRDVSQSVRTTATIFSDLFGNRILNVLRQFASFIASTVIPVIGTFIRSGLAVLSTVVGALSDRFQRTLLPSLLRLRDAFVRFIPPLLRLAQIFGNVLQVVISGLGRILVAIIPSLAELGGEFSLLGLFVEVVAFSLNVFAATLEIVVAVVEEFIRVALVIGEVLSNVGRQMGLITDESERATNALFRTAQSTSALGDSTTELDDKLQQLEAQQSDTAESADDVTESLFDTLFAAEDAAGGFDVLGDSVEETTSKLGGYFTEALNAETATIDLDDAIFAVASQSDVLGDAIVDVTAGLDTYTNTQVEAAKLTAEIKVATELYDEALANNEITIEQVRSELDATFGSRINDINATIRQEEANRRLAEVIGTALVNAFSAADSAIDSTVSAMNELDLAEQALADNPFDETLIEQAENARQNVTSSFEQIQQAYRQMVFDIIASSDGVFDTLDAELGQALGIFTEVEADLRLNEQQFQNALTALFGTIDQPNIEFVSALDAAVEAGEIDIESINQVLANIRTAVDEGFGAEIQGTIDAALSLALVDGEIDTSDVQNIIEATDLLAETGGVIEAEVAAVITASLDATAVDSLIDTVNQATDTIQNQFERERVINSIVDVALSGEVNATELQSSIDQVLQIVQDTGLSFDQALQVLIEAEAETTQAQAELDTLALRAGELDATTVNVDAQGNVLPAVGAFESLQQTIAQVDGFSANATATAFVQDQGLNELATTLDQVAGTSATANVAANAAEAATSVQAVGTGLEAIDGTTAAVSADFTDNASIPLVAFTGIVNESFAQVVETTTTSSAEMSDAVNLATTQMNESTQVAFTAMTTTVIDSSLQMSTNVTQNTIVMMTATQTAVATMNTSLANISVGASAFITVISAMVSTYTNELNKLTAASTTTVSQIQDIFVGANWNNVGTQMAGGIAAGFSSGTGAIISAAQQAVQEAISAAEAEAGIQSPSTVAAERVGEPITEGIAVGIVGKLPSLLNTVGGVVSSLVDAVAQVTNELAQELQVTPDTVNVIAGAFPLSDVAMRLRAARMSMLADSVGNQLPTDLLTNFPSSNSTVNNQTVHNNEFNLTQQLGQSQINSQQVFRLMEMLNQ